MPNQAIASSSSAKWKADRLLGNFISRQSFTMRDIVCDDAPEEKDGKAIITLDRSATFSQIQCGNQTTCNVPCSITTVSKHD